MGKDPGIGYRVKATVTGVKGKCNAGHQEGDTFEISCHNPGGLCGFFYHDIFPNLSTFQFGGNLPWWEGDMIQLQCPDSYNLVSLKLERSKRTQWKLPIWSKAKEDLRVSVYQKSREQRGPGVNDSSQQVNAFPLNLGILKFFDPRFKKNHAI